MDREFPSVKGTSMPLHSIGDVGGSGEIRGRDGIVFQRLGLTVETVRNLLGRRGSDNVRSLECSSAGKILWSGCRNESPPANYDCCVGSSDPQEGSQFEGLSVWPVGIFEQCFYTC
jgi:hypothetical protein